MELIWKELPGEHMIYSGIAQAAVEGDIPVPQGRSVREVLSCTGSVTLSDTMAREGAVAVEGTVSVDVICTDGSVFAFSSKASFRHTIPAEAVREGMKAQVQPIIPQRANVIGEAGDGEKALLLNGHLDVVPAVGEWSSAPFVMTERDGKFFGRGTAERAHRRHDGRNEMAS